MNEQADYGFVGREPEERPPVLTDKQVNQLCAYINALATVRGQQLSELGLTDKVVLAHSPEYIRGHAQFLRELYLTEALRRGDSTEALSRGVPDA